jgi:hypothetical protein
MPCMRQESPHTIFLQQEQKYQRGTQGHASRDKAIYEPNLKSDMDRRDHPEGV